MQKKRAYPIVFLSISLLLVTGQCVAEDLIPLQSNYYYQLGGGSDMVIPPVQTNTQITIGGDINTNLGYNCGAFNPSVSISNSINNLDDSIEGLTQSVIGSAMTAIGSLPMYALEKADPELYNLIQNAMLGAQNTFNVSMKSCQQAQSDIAKGQSPYQDWFSVSNSQGWMKNANAAADNQDIDINDAQKDSVQHGAEYGVPWVHQGQNSGGSQAGQVPIKVINDVAVAGYNILVDPTRPLDSDVAPSKGQDDYLITYWPTPDDAGKWATMVLGDITITANQSDAAQATAAGVGLTALMTTCPDIGNSEKTCAKTLTTNLTTLVTQSGNATPDELRAVSASNLVITQQVINAMRNQDSETQTLSINRLAQDVAAQNLIEEGLLMRRILTAGSQAQAVANLEPAQKNIQKALGELDNDINNVLFEHNVRQQLMTNALQMVLGDESGKEAAASQNQGHTTQTPMSHGAVYQEAN